ncbi:ABC-type branched-chain amino acid transport system, permease component [Klenkia soli]|uniref:ABC-type branched-chain amino acid transport system, permease component n=1 Tax=Klenkia soli TaxID=1052260 RepID=A0A1H0M015_9ACTN|nr:branched-chain amino acid ABC transporter permease [Klenkia soli]SDO73641.1 ABC-type branched-chain amino acid transport system, permease component [Klenkia soli]
MKKLSLPPVVGRLLACLAGGVVLAMMVGTQQGSQQDYGLSFREAVLDVRIVWFLLLGLLVFVVITYKDLVTPYLQRPGVRPLVAGVLVLIASFFLLTWYDPLSDGKFGAFADAVTGTPQIAPLARAFFGWLWLVGLIGVPVLIAVAIVLRVRVLAWVAAVVAVVVGVLAVVADSTAGDFAGGIDHSFGSVVALLGFLVLAFAAGVVARSTKEVATPTEFLERVMAYRPGLPLVVVGLVLGLLSLTGATWLAPTGDNLTLVDTSALFEGSDLDGLSAAVLGWLAYVLLVVVLAAAGAAVWLRSKPLGLAAAGLAVVSVLLVLITLHGISSTAAEAGYGSGDGPWQNLGTGGWVLCIGLFLIGAGAVVAALQDVLPATAAVSSDAAPVTGSGRLHAAARSTTGRSLALFAVGLALFYPPTANQFWQQSLTTTIGVYVLLAVGLNVVIGWAGLLDLGFIAFYAIGSYTTAYLTGSLPVQPPSWLLLSPLWAIPVAILICLIAGVLLGAPTLRLRGDYLAIVTLGFGEIIRIVAVNNPGEFTNGPRGVATPVPHPVIDLGFIRIEWGNSSLQYWYLLLILLAIVLIFFYRLEGSRLGRSWAAVREDEVAAQATGVNTTRVKLLAFAIGASTSGLAGVFFGSQVGYFNPQNFVLNNSILIVAYVVFGGMGSLVGAIAGAAALTWLPEFLRDQVPAEDRTMWIGAVLLVMMIFRPQGLIPARRRKAELTGLAGHDGSVRPGIQAVPASEGT